MDPTSIENEENKVQKTKTSVGIYHPVHNPHVANNNTTQWTRAKYLYALVHRLIKKVHINHTTPIFPASLGQYIVQEQENDDMI